MSTSKYEKYGASATKSGLHNVLENINQNVDSSLFSPICKDFSLDKNYSSFIHSDGAGTKTIIPYLMYQESKDPSVFKGLAQDALVMNLDDILCIGRPESLILSNFISRNTSLINDDILSVLIKSYFELSNKLKELGIDIKIAGGETADCGDVVRTLTVDAVLAGRIKNKNLIRASSITEGDVIVGLSSTGKASYESFFNSGISSNGLTLARHALLSSSLKDKFPEIVNPKTPNSYSGPFTTSSRDNSLDITIGEALSSATRTYAPILLKVYESLLSSIHGVIHCTGGGQTKVIRFSKGCKFIKDNLFNPPPIFNLIKKYGEVSLKEMYQVFNMGHRMEIYIEREKAKEVIDISKSFNVDAKIIGRVEKNEDKDKNQVEIHSNNEVFTYSL